MDTEEASLHSDNQPLPSVQDICPCLCIPDVSKRAVWQEPFLLSPFKNQQQCGFWDPNQWLYLKIRGLETLFTRSPCVSMLTLCTSGKLLPYFRRGLKNDCQQPQQSKFLHRHSKSGTGSSQIQHITLTDVSTLMGCLLVSATNEQAKRMWQSKTAQRLTSSCSTVNTQSCQLRHCNFYL